MSDCQIDEKFWKTLIIHSIIEGFLEKDINDLGSVKISETGKKYFSNPEDFYIMKDNDFSISHKTKKELNSPENLFTSSLPFHLHCSKLGM